MAFPKKCLAIDIGSHQIKIAEIIRSGATTKIQNYAMIDTPKGSVNDGMLVNKEDLAELIKSTLKSSKLKMKEVIFTLASSKIITREVEFPNLKPAKLATVIKMNAAEYFPVNLDEYILDHYIIDTIKSEGETQLKVNIIAALSELVEDYVTLAHMCDLKPAGIDYSGISLANFAVKAGLNEGVNILLDIGSHSTMVSIIDQGVMKFNRNLMYGSSLLIDSIKSHFEVEEDEALRISMERSLFDNENIDNPYLSNDMTGSMNQILTGIGRLIDYYTSRNQGKIDRIYLVGGGSVIHGITDYIQGYFDLPTIVPDDFSNIVSKSKVGFEDEQIYFVNILGAVFSEITLVSKSMLTKEENKTQTRTLILLALLVIIPIGMLTYFKWDNINKLEDKKAQLTIDIQNAQSIREIKNAYDAANNRVAFRQSIINNSVSTTDTFSMTLDLLETIMPEDVFYLTLVNSETGLAMNCVAKDKLTVAEFIVSMKEAGFVNVNVPSLSDSTTDEEAGYVSFSLTCDYGGDMYE